MPANFVITLPNGNSLRPTIWAPIDSAIFVGCGLFFYEKKKKKIDAQPTNRPQIFSSQHIDAKMRFTINCEPHFFICINFVLTFAIYMASTP